MKVAYVTPRYGTEVVGGAEHAARMLAERLAVLPDWEIEVITSCALDSGTWANEYAPGEAGINGVRVKRFPVIGPRHVDFLATSAKVMAQPRLAMPGDLERWIDQQGPLAPGILEEIASSDADVVVFYPYLFYPTVRGISCVRSPSVMHPAAHDEVPIRLPVFSKVFAAADAFVFQTDGERRLAERLFPIADKPQLLLGLGVEPRQGDVPAFRKKAGIGARPYVLCLGRVDAGKGSALLAKYFIEYKRRRPSDLALVLVGPTVQENLDLDGHPDVVVTGLVSEEEKWGALRDARLLVSPSPFEAFSLALVEAWSATRPVMVNASCLATREHVERSGGGLWFDGYASFEAGLDRLVDDRNVASALAAAGNQYVESRFGWQALIERYSIFLTEVAAHRRTPVQS